jgi:histidinol-phosphate/aromatic aminotransferase/cobyric acid decarboxylase-like protein
VTSHCYHGGAFWNEIGPGFDRLDRREDVVAADVLDAWFLPAPEVLNAIVELEWLCRTSPPTHAEGLVEAISRVRRIAPANILPGPGSSAILYQALPRWLSASAKVLLVEPCYGEYAHLCRSIGCQVEWQITLSEHSFALDLDAWSDSLKSGDFDLAVLVNPNNPTGASIDTDQLRNILSRIPAHTRVLIDEAYVDFVGISSCEPLTLLFPNLFVLKSLSKCFALSGLRAAYLIGDELEMSKLRLFTPPWWVSLPAQVASIAAIGCEDYYSSRYAQTQFLRLIQAQALQKLGVDTYGAANWLLAKLPRGSSASFVVDQAQSKGVFLRHAGRTAHSLGDEWIRIAIRSESENARILEALGGSIKPERRA